MAISDDVPLVDSAFGKVHKSSPISYWYPVPVSWIILFHPDAPPPLPLPLDGYRLEPTCCQFVCSLQQQLHLQSLETNLDMARKIKAATREECLCRVAPSQDIFPLQGLRDLPCLRSKFSRTPCWANTKGCGSNSIDGERPGIGACCQSGVLLGKEHQLLALCVCRPLRCSLGSIISWQGCAWPHLLACWRSNAQMPKVMLTVNTWNGKVRSWEGNSNTAITGRSKTNSLKQLLRLFTCMH